MTDIPKFIPDLSSTCKLYYGTISGKHISCEEALSLVAFYNSFPSIKDMEAGIVDLLLNVPNDGIESILKSLYSDLNEIIRWYDFFDLCFEDFDLYSLWTQPLSYINKEIEIQHQKTIEASDEHKEASNSYEMTPFNGMSKAEADILERRANKLKEEYDKEKVKLQNLYVKRKSIEEERGSVPIDIFKLIYLKCLDILPIVEKYYKKPVDNKKEQSISMESFFSMLLSGHIYKLCNGIQFEAMSELDFFESLNLHKKSNPLKVRKYEKVRVCYLINQLSEQIEEKERRNEWIGAMLRVCGIAPDYYRSKYRESISDLPSKKNNEFAEALKEILG